MDQWGRERAGRIMEIVGEALPGENLSEDEVVTNLFDDPDRMLVVGDDSAGAFGGAVVRERDGRRVAHVQLLAVSPSSRRNGHGRRVLDALHEWAFDEHFAEAVIAGAGSPFYLFAGVDVHATAALCLFEAAGYRHRGAELNVSFPSRFRARAPDGVGLSRVLEEADARAAVDFCRRHWPGWVPELERGIEHGSCQIARTADGTVIGFGCHSVNRLGWLGPIGTDPAARGRGVGTALLSVISTDVMAAGLDRVEVSWIGPIGFYAKSTGATVSRVFRSLSLFRRA